MSNEERWVFIRREREKQKEREKDMKEYLESYEPERKIYKFPNGYGASVIRGIGIYGSNQGLWELAVLKGDKLCYSTPITDDVINFLNDKGVEEILEKIKNLPKENEYES